MRQERKFCAELYHLLHEHIDYERPVYLCLDGVAAKKGVSEGLLPDAVVPDFLFHFLRAVDRFLMEAKIVADNKVKFCGRGQLEAWAREGPGLCKPILWVAANDDLTRFYLWQHVHFDEDLTRGPNAKGELRIPLDHVGQHDNLDGLAKAILHFARAEGYYPAEGDTRPVH